MKKFLITKEQLLNAMLTYKTTKELALHFNVSLSSIRRRLKKFNLSTFSYSFDTKKFLELYNKGYNDTEISRELRVCHSTISDYRNKLNLKQNFSYNREQLKNKILNLGKISKLSVQQIANQLNVDYRIVLYFLNEPNIDLNKYLLSDEEYQVLIGGLLGDGNITLSRSKNLARFIFAHSESQKEYCIWKTEILKNIMYYERVFQRKEHWDKRTNKTYISYFSYSKDMLLLKSFYDKWYIDSKKHICKDDLFNLNALGVAVWYMDDGFKHKNCYYISTNCFSKEDLEIVKEYFLKKWNIKITINKQNIVYIPAKYRDSFTNIIKPYIHFNCLYKLCNSK